MASPQAIHSTFGRTNTAAAPAVFRARDPRTWPAGIPQPVMQCDGSTMRVPVWDPEARAWSTTSVETGDGLRKNPIITEAECGDRECTQLHVEDWKTPEELRTLARINARRYPRQVAFGRGRK
jgi:hypothetical protein